MKALVAEMDENLKKALVNTLQAGGYEAVVRKRSRATKKNCSDSWRMLKYI